MVTQRYYPRSTRLAVLLGVTSAILSGVATIFLILWPGFYQGKNTANASLIEVNGYSVMVLLLIPIVLAFIVLLVIKLPEKHQVKRKIAIWVPTSVSLLFCLFGFFSIGAFYLPANVALLTSAIFASKQKPCPV